MIAADIMTKNVITVTPDTPVVDIARLLMEKRISAVPVVENGRPVGSSARATCCARSSPGRRGRRAGSSCSSRATRWRPSTSMLMPAARGRS